ncbi:MFS transporter [Ensifer sp. Root31]|nr:MFS transporter [Ensifer sp. Root31]
MVAGMMPSLAQALNVSVAEIGYLISLYAVGMIIGGPLLTTLFLSLRISNKVALLWQLALYCVGGIIAATASGYEVMAVARLVTGIAGSACIGVSLAICGELVSSQTRGRASSIVISGMMLATVLGVPAATVIDQGFGWRASFWLAVAAVAAGTIVVYILVPNRKRDETAHLLGQLKSFCNRQLWAAYATSGLIIGAAYAAFSYIAPIMIDLSGVQAASMPLLLSAYGVANLIGTTIVGRFADRHTWSVMVFGVLSLAAAIAVLGFFAEIQIVGIAAVLIIGLTGSPLSPAMIARVMRVAEPGALVNSVHVSVINGGLAFIAWAGGHAIDVGQGLKSPLWIGLILALLALASLVPQVVRTSMASSGDN